MKLISKLNSIRARLFSAFLVIGLLPLIASSLYIGRDIQKNIVEFENKDNHHYVNQVDWAIQKLIRNELRLIEDYSNWDDMYLAVKGGDIPWIKGNITDRLPEHYDVDYVAIYDPLGDLVIENGGDYYSLELFSTTNINREAKESKIISKGSLYILTTSPIISEISNDISGYMVFLREIDDKLIKDNILMDYFSIRILVGEQLPISYNNLLNAANKQQDRIYIEKHYDNYSVIYSKGVKYLIIPIRIEGAEPAFVIVEADTSFLTGIINMFKYSSYVSYGIGFGLIIIITYLMTHTILVPITEFKRKIEKITQTRKPVPLSDTKITEVSELIGAFNRMAEELDDYNTTLEQLAITDDLTGLYNHRYLNSYIDDAISNGNNTITLVLFDVHFYKYYEQLFSREKADALMAQLGYIMKIKFMDLGVLARLDTTTFALCSLDSDMQDISTRIADLRNYVESIHIEGKEKLPDGYVTISAGVSSYPWDCKSKKELIQRADEQLYKAKNFLSSKIGIYYPILRSLNEDGSMEIREINLIAKTLLSLIDSMDNYTLSHSEGVAKYSLAIGKAMGLSGDTMEVLKYGAILHDVGKIELGSRILNKREKLTEEEYAEIKMHPIYGVNIIKPLEQLKDIIPIIRHHHERFDGGGYPDGLMGKEIPLLAAIVAVADSFDAMTTIRPYKGKAKSINEAKAELIKYSGTQFDKDIVDVFLTIVDDMY